MKDFWKSAGMHLVVRDENGWLSVTPDYIRAYLTRPEIHPVEDSCEDECKLFEKLMAEPFGKVDPTETAAIKDLDAADNYKIILAFRDHLAKHKTIEAAYLALFSGETITIPPVFIDQMVHLILRNILDNVDDPMLLRAAELFYREQVVTMVDEQLMLADQEIVEMRSTDGFGGLGQLLAETGTPAREISLDVMTEANKAIYWDRSDQFDMAVDLRFTQPASDALGYIIKRWVNHFLGIETRVQAMKAIRDEKWSWHVGCDAESTRILNALYNGQELNENELMRILALYRIEFLNQENVMDTVQGKPVYLGVAMNHENKLIFKPQNLLTNLPLQAPS